ncbi:MAG TPA: hypothetical protein VKY26_11365, partial [Actinomycetota bacterium]|nr:hypothetical protein [Actinomycetota bacterium]
MLVTLTVAVGGTPALAAPATTTLTTTASAGVTIGGSISDSAMLSGATSPTGSVTFTVYGPNDSTCAKGAVATLVVAVTGPGPYVSPGFVPQSPGTYNFTAAYSGDGANAASSESCGGANESVVVAQASPGLVTMAAPAQVALGSAVTDTATISGGDNPGGSISFALYGPNDPGCAHAPISQVTDTVRGDGSYTAASSPSSPGSYLYTASYSGDTDNRAVSGT